MKYGVYSVALAAALFANTASAALIDNGYFVTDTATGLDWLDLTQTQTVNTDYSTVMAEMTTGGQLG